jgi:RNA polymerase sigma-70 factor, ECF subfamily
VSPPHEQRIERDSSFERLYRLHRRDVYGAVLRDVRDPSEAEDVTQIAFLNAFRAMRKGEQPDKPRAWLVTIARNVIRRRYRELVRRPQEVALDPDVAVALTDVEGPTVGEISAAIRRLPPSQRRVILLREIQGRSYAEIAGEMGLSLAAVETLIFRARRSLSEAFEVADHVPATQSRRRRALALLPLPGFGKLSLGFSAGRLAVAALVGSVIVAVPVTDGVADPRRTPGVERAPSSVATAPVGLTPTALAPEVTAVDRERERADRRPAREETKREDESKEEGGSLLEQTATSPVPLPQSGVPSADDLPAVDELPLPPLPVEPALPPVPDPTTVLDAPAL